MPTTWSRAAVSAAAVAVVLVPAAARARPLGHAGVRPVVTRISVRGAATSGAGVADALVVHGRHLRRAGAVLFGHVEQRRPTRISDTEIETEIPAHAAGTVQVRVRTTAGTSRATAATTFSYEDVPHITSLGRTDGPTSGGTRITVRGDHFEHATRVTFGGVAGTRMDVTGGHRLSVVTPRHGAATVAVRVRFPFGGSAAATYRYGTTNTVHWSTPDAVDQGQPSMAVSCPTTAFCAATDSANNYLNDNAGTWSAPARAAGGASVSCPSANFCVSVAQNLTFAWDGSAWTRVSNPFPNGSGDASAAHLRHVVCTSATFCLVSSGTGAVSTWDGSTRTPLTRIAASANYPGADVSAVSCWADGQCAAVADDALYELTGEQWHQTRGFFGDRSTSANDSLSCSDAQHCQIGTADGTVVEWTTSGFVDTAHVLPGGDSVVACTSDMSCVAADGQGTATWDGEHWSVSRATPRVGDADLVVTGLSCPAEHSCVAVGSGDASVLTW